MAENSETNADPQPGDTYSVSHEHETAAGVTIVLDANDAVLSVLERTGFHSLGDTSSRLKTPFLSWLTGPSQIVADRLLASVRAGARDIAPIVLNHRHADRGDLVSIRYQALALGSANHVVLMGEHALSGDETSLSHTQNLLALERAEADKRLAEQRLRHLMQSLPEPTLLFQASDGLLTKVNAAAEQLLGMTREQLLQTRVHDVLDFGSDGGLQSLGNLVVQALSGPGQIPRARIRQDGRMLNLTPTVFQAVGQFNVILRIQPDQSSDVCSECQNGFTGLVQHSPDAMVTTTTEGRILQCNPSFLDLLDLPTQGALDGRTLVDFLGNGDTVFGALRQSAEKYGQVRRLETRTISVLGNESAVDVSVTYLPHDTAPALGFVFRVRPDAKQESEEQALHRLAELVAARLGDKTMRDIISETVDTVEQICIEQAVAETNNNRVAAAEILGLSRQSLYVKLRKYGILSRDALEDER